MIYLFSKKYILVIVIRNSFNIDLYFTIKYFKFLQYPCSNPQQLAFSCVGLFLNQLCTQWTGSVGKLSN